MGGDVDCDFEHSTPPLPTPKEPTPPPLSEPPTLIPKGTTSSSGGPTIAQMPIGTPAPTIPPTVGIF